jgi:hypothetical protein
MVQKKPILGYSLLKSKWIQKTYTLTTSFKSVMLIGQTRS